MNSAFEYVSNEFLKTLAEKAEGDITKKFKIDDIWSQSKINSIDKSQLPIILNSLQNDKLITRTNMDNSIQITYNGIYKISNIFKIPPTTLGILSYQDLKYLTNLFLEIIRNETKNKKDKTVDIKDIQKTYLSSLGNNAIFQISQFSKDMGLLEEIKGEKTKVKLNFREPIRGFS